MAGAVKCYENVCLNVQSCTSFKFPGFRKERRKCLLGYLFKGSYRTVFPLSLGRDELALTRKAQLSDKEKKKGQNNRSSTVPHNAFVQEMSSLNQANAGSACLYRGRGGGGGHRRGSFVLHTQPGKLEHGAHCIPTPPLLNAHSGKIYTA